jgi:hypothetical protein
MAFEQLDDLDHALADVKQVGAIWAAAGRGGTWQQPYWTAVARKCQPCAAKLEVKPIASVPKLWLTSSRQETC